MSKLPVEHLLAAATAADPVVRVLICDLFSDGSGLSVLLQHYDRQVACSLTGSLVVRPCVGDKDRRPAWQWRSSRTAAELVFGAMVAALTPSERDAINQMYTHEGERTADE